MTEPSLKKFRPKPLHAYEEKARRCLMCRRKFESSWPGERVCTECKAGRIWREGVSLGDQYQ